MKNVLRILSVIFGCTFSLYVHAENLAQADRRLLKEVTMRCGDSLSDGVGSGEDPGFYLNGGPDSVNFSVLRSGDSGTFSTCNNTQSHFEYGPEITGMIVAAARVLKERDWVVTNSGYTDSAIKGRVIARSLFQKMTKGSSMCGSSSMTDGCEYTTKLVNDALGKNYKCQPPQFPQCANNTLEAVHVNMLTFLTEHGYKYDPIAKTWSPSAGSPELSLDAPTPSRGTTGPIPPDTGTHRGTD